MLEDVNDEIPLFAEREQETVLEGEPIGTKVTTVHAVDKDGTEANNKVLKVSSITALSLIVNYFILGYVSYCGFAS